RALIRGEAGGQILDARRPSIAETFFWESAVSGDELGSRGFQRDPVLQLGVQADRTLAIRRREHEGAPDIELAVEDVEELEALRQDADDRARRSVDVQRSANDARVRAKLTTPEAMTQNDHAVAARPAIVAGERPADRRRHAED